MSRFSAIFKSSLVLLLTVGSLQIAVADDDDDGDSWWGGRSRHSEGSHNDGNRSEGKRNDRYGNEGGNNSSRGGMASNAPPQYQKECASCHMAYPAGLLPAGSWQHLMGNLSQHYGSDASLDAASASTLTQYLTSNSGTYKRVSEMPPQDRITESYWFQRKHGKHVNPGTWARPSIGSPANCVACHQGAERGDFNEHSVRIPG